MEQQATGNLYTENRLTAVQQRNDPLLYSYTIHGTPVARQQGLKGEIYLYEAGHIVGYIVNKLHNKRAFIFATCNGPGTHKVPGVFPEVRLLIETRSKGKTRRLVQYIEYARKNKIVLDNLPKDFFVRLNTLLEERKNSSRDFRNLLQRWAS